jgi:hypothetical protein
MIPPTTSALLELFEGPLQNVHFPQADGESLNAASKAFEAAHAAVLQAQLALDCARTSLLETTAHLQQLTERTLAYARIYAQDHPDLLMTLPVAQRPVARARRRADASEDAQQDSQAGDPSSPPGNLHPESVSRSPLKRFGKTARVQALAAVESGTQPIAGIEL